MIVQNIVKRWIDTRRSLHYEALISLRQDIDDVGKNQTRFVMKYKILVPKVKLLAY